MPDKDNRKNTGKKDSRVIRKIQLEKERDVFDPDPLEEVKFDISEEDVERYRRLEQEKAKRKDREAEKRRAAGKTKTARTGSRPGRVIKKENLEEVDEAWLSMAAAGSDTVFGGMLKQRDTNKEILRLNLAVLIIFFGMIAYFIYFSTARAKSVVNNPHNGLLSVLEDKVVRGDIMASDGTVLATTLVNSDGTMEREYPYGRLFAHAVGTSEINLSGAELYAGYDLVSSDTGILEGILYDITGQRPPGHSVYTTLDLELQKAAYDALGDRNGVVVAIEPSTGKILAMVSKPDYDPNTLTSTYYDLVDDEDNNVLYNRATLGLYAPGSVFKIVTTTAFLRSGAHTDDFTYTCEGSIYLYNEDDSVSPLNCYHGEVHGLIDFEEAFAESCNSAFADIGIRLGAKQLRAAAESLYFNKDLPGSINTSTSSFTLTTYDSQWKTGATSIGQGDTLMTPLHAALLASAIANDGVLCEPYLIEKVVSSSGEVLETTQVKEPGTLFSNSELSTLLEYMKAVVDYGTAAGLNSLSYDVAGKTGTAEVSGQSGDNAWFVGFAPADDPKIAICVLVEDSGASSQYAVPVARQIFEEYLGD
ncbi:MAG: penicillin-binding protein 2 [Lachnospiraceae bacterium]|nr:penicillin-binding protein 2 [Lachnospiraceae bacterium]